MSVEISVSGADDKRRVLHALRRLGFDAASGPVRLAHPFSILVDGASRPDPVLRAARTVDPSAAVVAATA